MLHQIFGGFLQSQIRCPLCGYESNTFDPFWDLSLDVASSKDILHALCHFTSPETLDKDNKYTCDGCKRKICARKQLTIREVPRILILHLKRFSSGFGLGGAWGGKHKGGGINLARIFQGAKPPPDRPCQFDLFAVNVHSGSTAHSGHYYCYAKSAAGIWHVFDDESVRPVGIDTVLGSQAYMLFYRIIGEKPNPYDQPGPGMPTPIPIPTEPTPSRPSVSPKSMLPPSPIAVPSVSEVRPLSGTRVDVSALFPEKAASPRPKEPSSTASCLTNACAGTITSPTPPSSSLQPATSQQQPSPAAIARVKDALSSPLAPAAAPPVPPNACSRLPALGDPPIPGIVIIGEGGPASTTPPVRVRPFHSVSHNLSPTASPCASPARSPPILRHSSTPTPRPSSPSTPGSAQSRVSFAVPDGMGCGDLEDALSQAALASASNNPSPAKRARVAGLSTQTWRTILGADSEGEGDPDDTDEDEGGECLPDPDFYPDADDPEGDDDEDYMAFDPCHGFCGNPAHIHGPHHLPDLVIEDEPLCEADFAESDSDAATNEAEGSTTERQRLGSLRQASFPEAALRSLRENTRTRLGVALAVAETPENTLATLTAATIGRKHPRAATPASSTAAVTLPASPRPTPPRSAITSSPKHSPSVRSHDFDALQTPKRAATPATIPVVGQKVALKPPSSSPAPAPAIPANTATPPVARRLAAAVETCALLRSRALQVAELESDEEAGGSKVSSERQPPAAGPRVIDVTEKPIKDAAVGEAAKLSGQTQLRATTKRPSPPVVVDATRAALAGRQRAASHGGAASSSPATAISSGRTAGPMRRPPLSGDDDDEAMLAFNSVALSGPARAGDDDDVVDYRGSGRPGVAINEGEDSEGEVADDGDEDRAGDADCISRKRARVEDARDAKRTPAEKERLAAAVLGPREVLVWEGLNANEVKKAQQMIERPLQRAKQALDSWDAVLDKGHVKKTRPKRTIDASAPNPFQALHDAQLRSAAERRESALRSATRPRGGGRGGRRGGRGGRGRGGGRGRRGRGGHGEGRREERW